MYKMCKTEQSAQRQQELEQGLLKTMGAHQYDEISVSDLCSQIGIPRKSFYRYFSSKDGALYALIDHTLLAYESFWVPLKDSEDRTYEKDLEAFFQFWYTQKPLLDALTRSGLCSILVERSVMHVLSDAATPVRFLRQSEKITREYATVFSICGLMSMMLQWHHDGYSQGPQQMAAIAVQMLTQPVFAKAEQHSL